jgi:large subunit ribosomal protein L5
VSKLWRDYRAEEVKSQFMARLQEYYRKEVAPELVKQFGYTSPMSVPKFKKIVVNMGVGDAKDNVKLLEAAMNDLASITGQKPAVTRAKKSIANFKLREGTAIGCRVTLRGKRMYEFYDRMINVAIPRIRDFRGLPSNSFDGRGNYSVGIKEQVVFPEISYDDIERIQGMNITIVTSAETDEEALALLKLMNMPFRKQYSERGVS